MSFKIESPEGRDALTEFVLFFDQVNASRSARWPAPLELQLPILLGESPFCKDRQIQPFVARRGGEIVARVVALIDNRYNRHWNEELGHITWFEALPETDEAVKELMNAACAWLAERGVRAARAGFCLPMLEFPFSMDAYEILPPSLLRQNPPYYHTMLKRAGFEVEKGWVDYKLEVSPQLEEHWQSSLESVRQAGYVILPAKELTPEDRTREFTDLWNDTFKAHWGFSPFSYDEMAMLFAAMAETSLLETSVVAYKDEESVGFVFNASDDPSHAVLATGRSLDDSEKLNVLAIGVREAGRGQGVNYAMVGYSYLELARRGWTHLSYTLVRDDNWPSRRTGERLGCQVCANYLIHRRNFRG